MIRIGATITGVVSWLGGICYGIGNIVYQGLNYLFL